MEGVHAEETNSPSAVQRRAASGGQYTPTMKPGVTAPGLSILVLARDRRPAEGRRPRQLWGWGLQAHLLAHCGFTNSGPVSSTTYEAVPLDPPTVHTVVEA